ncbi:hypothetical protein Hte_007287 [Hypoxylon texense]
MAQSQQTLRTLKSIPLENYVPDGGHVRSDLMPKLGTMARSEFSVDFELMCEVHDGYDAGDEDKASLPVIRVVPRPDDLKRQFLGSNVLPEDTNGQRRHEDEDSVPLLTSIGSASSGDQFADVFTTNETHEIALRGTLQAQIYGVTPGIEGLRSSKSEFKAHHFLTVKSGTSRTNMALSRKRANCVWWEIRAANKEDGVGDSFTLSASKDVSKLKMAIENAADDSSGRATLMFCSTADEGMFSDSIYPADYDKLLLLRTYNNLEDLEDRDMRPFYTKQGIMRIFKKMDADKGGVQLSKLFPRKTADENSTRKTLAKNWNISNFPE